MKSLIIIVFIIISIPFAARSQNKRLSKHQYQLINNYFGTDSINGRSFKLQPALLPFKFREIDFTVFLHRGKLIPSFTKATNLDTLLTEDDYRFIKEQLKQWHNPDSLNIKSLKISATHILINDTRSATERMFPKFFTYRICLPLFSCNYNIALFYVEYYCGMECANGELEFLKKQENGDWKIIGAINIFVS